MSGIVKVNKDGLSSSASNIANYVSTISSNSSSLCDTLSSIPSHDKFGNVTTAASTISSSLQALNTDLKNLSSNIKTYIDSLIEIDGENITDISFSSATKSIDTSGISSNSNNSWSSLSSSNYGTYSGGTSSGTYSYSYSSGPSGTTIYSSASSPSISNNWGSVDTSQAIPGQEYNYEGIEKYIAELEGTTINLPPGLGNVHSYMGWQCITATTSTQYKLREVAGMNFDEDGFAKIGDRYVVATTTTFGKVGDYIDVYQEDGTVIKCIIGDIKNQNDAGCNEWGHDNGHCVVEFVVDKASWYGTNKTVNGIHPEFNKNITKIVNKGNYFDLIQTDAAKLDNETTESDVDSEEMEQDKE